MATFGGREKTRKEEENFGSDSAQLSAHVQNGEGEERCRRASSPPISENVSVL